MEAIRSVVLPRRLTQMYADTKKSYEHVIQTNFSNRQLSSTFLKLRIQKDRFIAWGLEWADSNAAQSGDIDGSLDRAGISDLVASIMSSIGELLDEAENIQPQRVLSDIKGGSVFKTEGQWDAKELTRLNEIVKDITASIDTLCDLSRTQQVLRPTPNLGDEKQLPPNPGSMKSSEKDLQVIAKVPHRSSASSPLGSPELASTTRIDPTRIRMARVSTAPGPSPPSYDSVAAGSDDRVFAVLMTSRDWKNSEGKSQSFPLDKPVLLDYGSISTTNPTEAQLPCPQRYKELFSALALPQQGSIGSTYTGTMRLLGWVEDPRRSRYAFVYEVPGFLPDAPTGSGGTTSPHSLLSFLQHGADTDSTNMPSLEDRFRLAFNLASSVLHLHAKGLCHRNINSTNVLFFANEAAPSSADDKVWKKGVIRRPYIASFDQCADDAPSEHQEPLMSSIYRHPETQRGERSTYKPTYDIYSLGLILLEIGLWMPLGRLWKTKYVRSSFKLRLQSIYIKKLAAKCGSTYMRLVEYCLRAADGGSGAQNSLQASGEDSRTPRLQTEFYWKVTKELERCCMIDTEKDEMIVAEPSNPAGMTDRNEMETPITRDSDTKQETPSSEETEEVRQPEAVNVLPALDEKIEPKMQPKRKCRVWSHDLPTSCTAYWNATMLPQLSRILSKVVDRWESVEIELVMVGETADVAKPTIYMVCASTEKARKALQYLNRDRRMFDIKVVKGQMTRSKAGKKRRRVKSNKKNQSPTPKSSETAAEVSQILNQRYQEKPTCGASIGAYADNQHLPPVSFGGTVLVDGEPYGMSVHHMLENEELDLGLDDEFDFSRSMAPRDHTVSFDESITAPSWCPEDLPEAPYPFEISEDEDEGYQSSAADDDSWLFDVSQWEDHDRSDQSLEADDVEMGDTPGIAPGQSPDLIVTQPAIDDVDSGFFPSEEDMDDDHLSSHTLGHVHASSGIKRSNRGGISHEVDWALINVKEDRLGKTNFIVGGGRHCKQKATQQAARQGPNASNTPYEDPPSYPCHVLKTEVLGGLKVHALGRTSGLQTGTILPAMTMVKMPGRVSFSHSWRVMGSFGSKPDRFYVGLDYY